MGLEVLGQHPSPVIPVMLYQPYKIGDFSRLAFNRRLAVVVVGAPATPVTLPRIRFCVSAAHSHQAGGSLRSSTRPTFNLLRL
jgi:serine palmitoyltransferase